MESQLIIPKESKANFSTTWKIYKQHWKTFIALTGFSAAVYFLYTIIDLILNIFGLASVSLTSYSDYESLGIGAAIVALLIRIPLAIFFQCLAALLAVLYYVIPALYFKNKEIITWKVPYKVLKNNFKRYLFAGILYGLVFSIGFVLCFIPGIVISFICPAYVNKIACTDMPIMEAFKSSFQAVFKSPNLWSYIGMLILAFIIYLIPTLCTCLIGSIITLPMISIYSQHLTYNKGILN